MNREHALKHLTALAASERRLSIHGAQYKSDPKERQSIRDRHKQNADALDLVLAECNRHPLAKVDFAKAEQFYLSTGWQCPEPLHQGDEYYCPRCSLRWDIHEEKPICQAQD